MPKKKETKDKENQILFAFLATFLSIIGFLIALIVKPDDKYVMYYAKQSLVIFIISILAGIIGNIFEHLFIIGTIIKSSLNILVVLIWALSWIYALSGKKKQIPIVSDWTKKINL